MKPVPAKDISKVLETSTSDGNNSLQGLINEKNFDEAAQMAYSIVTAVEEANIGSEDKQRVFYVDVQLYCELKINTHCPFAHLKNIYALQVIQKFFKAPDTNFFSLILLEWLTSIRLAFHISQVKEAVLEQISVVEINSMQQVTQLSAVVVVATEEEKGIDVSVQV